MKPGKLDLIIYRYAAFSRTLRLTVGDPTKPFDLAQFKVRAQFRAGPDSLEILCDLTEENGRIAVSGNEILIFLPRNISRSFEWESCSWDMTIEHVTDPMQTHRLVEGGVTVFDGVTR